MYEQRCTTLSMLVSSSPPADAGLQGQLAETLLDHGAALEGAGSKWQSALRTALAFGFLDTARLLASRGARVDDLVVAADDLVVAANDLVAAAGLGRREDAARLLPGADAASRHAALALAAQHGHAEVVALLLEAGEDPDRYNPEGLHAHATPLHHAALAGHLDAVRLLVEHGARLDLPDTIYGATPLGWANHAGRNEVATYLRGRGAPE
jgi:ankyrin repeat protein